VGGIPRYPLAVMRFGLLGPPTPTLPRKRGRGLLVAALLLLALPARAEIAVVATTPDLKSLAEAVGGDAVRVASLVPPGSDAEAYEPRPGDLIRLRGAALVIRVGLGYDHWLDRLLAQHGDKKLARGQPAHVDASLGIPLLEVQGRSVEIQPGGHAHGLANPHYWLDPENAATITAAIVDGLAAVAPSEAARFAANRERFLAVLAEHLAIWQTRLAPQQGAAIVAYHNAWPYLARRFRLNIVDVVEPKEGIAPSPARLARLAGVMREKKVRAVLVEPYSPQDAAQSLASRTGARLAVLAPSVGSVPEASDYLALFEFNVDVLARALSADGS
jgi:ABC-type Zn uptake system ZnuABC Zn-binding protein ZnuA